MELYLLSESADTSGPSFFSRCLIIELQIWKGAKRPGANARAQSQILFEGSDFREKRDEMSRSKNDAW
jgi:hypothetical protein